MKTLFLTIILFSLSAQTFGQESDRWRGLILDESTSEQATEKLGKPKSEKTSDKFMSHRNKSLRDRSDLRVLHWEKAEGFEDVKLYFIGDKLALIQLEKPKNKIPAKVFVDAYPGVDFKGARNTNAAFYELEAVTPKSTISAGIGNVLGNVFGGLRNLDGGQIDKLDGNVVRILIQSRRIDDKRGVDALK